MANEIVRVGEMELVEKPPIPNIPIKWDYESSVKKVVGHFYKWSKLTVEIAQELYIAREKLSVKPASRQRKPTGTFVPVGKNWDTYCDEIGGCRRTVNRWLAYWFSVGSLVGKLTGNAENYTQQETVDRVRAVLGEIDLDPASCDMAQEKIKAKKYYTAETNGLDKKWSGRVFLNPPYGMPLIREFTDKLIQSLPDIESAILLTNDQTDTDWWHNCALNADVICLPDGRESFYTPTKDKTSPTNGQTFFYYGNKKKRFIEIFKDKGLMVKVI
jgi:hypothetical protein